MSLFDTSPDAFSWLLGAACLVAVAYGAQWYAKRRRGRE